jgi:uncharacterized protein YerC
MNVQMIKTALILIQNAKESSVKKNLALEGMTVARIANVRKRNTSSAMIRNNVLRLAVEEETNVSLMQIAKVIRTQNAKRRCVSRKMVLERMSA